MSVPEEPLSEEPRPEEPLSEETDPRTALAAALRRMITTTVAAPLSDEELAAAAAAVSEVADRLDASSGPGRRDRRHPEADDDPQQYFPTSPAIGTESPLAPPVLVRAEDGAIKGSVWFDYAYEGPPGCVHGGVIAQVFDEILGCAIILSGNPGMTGTLTVRYGRPTPIRTPLRVEAAFVERSGRRVRVRGAIYRDEELTAEAEGVFIQLGPERMLRIFEERGEGAPA
jgi:acyl-coenzyme A thioesterase PaaI-like protein